ncbi:uncharacterized protein LOC110445205 isoform X2 [Mizuhopecten yessoensis]|uniref:Uncharacterized protein n=1 Tax=Mizuhopecten yessoensis TaxID=6573 RepID=A0A210R0G2_MIZYE|nr:uncharacterized protein LOC110445205 isoform X2 [Mizuhopecten yessoensis]OWF54371.1 hypothetical protein KP79_PYT08322 [Mizuhopecten yessoensis]
MARLFSFRNPVTGKPLAPKKPKPQKLCGWEVDDVTSHTLGIETWSNLQVQIHERHGKLKNVPEHATYKHLPKRRCSGFEDTDSFEKESLHEHFFRRKPDIEDSNTSINSSPNTVTQLPNGPARKRSTHAVRVRTAGSVRPSDEERSKTRDDLGVPYKESGCAIQTLPRTGLPFGLTRAVTDLGEERSPTMRRMLYYSRKYASKDDDIHDEEEDEGYDSKTPSEEKEIKLFETPLIINQCSPANGRYHQDFARASKNGQRVAKFSYTHLSSRPVGYGPFDDDPRNGADPRTSGETHKKSKQYLEESKENIRNSRKLERSHTVMVDKNDTITASEDRPSTIILRKISIQNSHGEGTHETVFDLQKSFHRSQTTINEHTSDMENYPVNVSSSELTCPQHRPYSRTSQKITIDSSKLATGDVLRKTHAGIFDLQRSHTTVCMPIGELLPMADHFHTKSTLSAYPELPTTPSSARDPEDNSKLANMDDASLDYYSIHKNNTLCSGPFRQAKSSQDVSIRKPTVPHVDIYPHSAPVISPSPQEPRTRLTHSKPKEGLPSGSFLPKMPTLAVRRKRKTEKKPEIKLSTNPDRDTKKKLRDAFSRFYNRRSYGPNRNVNWSEDLRFVWNT